MEGSIVNTPKEIIDSTMGLYGADVEEMIERESTEFIEGFVAALLLYKTLQIGVQLNTITGDLPEEASQEVLDAQIDTVITLLAEYLQEQRNRN
jgi:uncharacterized membrane protein YqgA involved in biofilm formation